MVLNTCWQIGILVYTTNMECKWAERRSSCLGFVECSKALAAFSIHLLIVGDKLDHLGLPYLGILVLTEVHHASCLEGCIGGEKADVSKGEGVSSSSKLVILDKTINPAKTLLQLVFLLLTWSRAPPC